MRPLRHFAIGIVLLTSIFPSYSQKVDPAIGPAYERLYDSITTMEYHYLFPFLGKQAYQRGYDLPYAWGAGLVYFTQQQQILIDRVLIGLNGGRKADLSNFIVFGPTIATTHAVTFRPDLWVLPFLNLYGVIGGGTTTTEVTLLEPLGFETSQRFEAQSFGLGATLTGAWGPLIIIWDNNYNFAEVEVLVEPVPAFNSSLRLAHNFRDPNHPQKMLTFWAGAFYQNIQSDTKGSIAISEIFPSVGSGDNIESLREWAAELPLAQRLVANQIIDKLEDYGNNNDVGNAQIDYELQKKVAAPLNLIVGAQYQFNKRWMLRTELGVFGKRSQFLLNLNYRFPGF